MIRVASGLDPVRMSYLHAMLTADGIETDFYTGAGTLAVYRLYVRPQDEAQARALLNTLGRTPLPPPTPEG